MKKLFLILLISSVLGGTAAFCAPVFAGSDTDSDIEPLIESIIAYQIESTGCDTLQQWLDNSLAMAVGSYAEWYIMALTHYDNTLDYSSVTGALRSCAEDSGNAGTLTRQRISLALIACGCHDDDFVVRTAGNSISETGIMSLVFGLHLLNNGVTPEEYGADGVVSQLLAMQRDDGGWSLSGDCSDVDVTAMTVQALAPYYNTDDNVKSAVDSSIALLSQMQLGNGGFSSFGEENPECAAQVIVALSSLGIDIETDERFVKNGYSVLDALSAYRLENGAYSHSKGGEYNLNATMQVFYSLVSLDMQKSGTGSLYIFPRGNIIPPDASSIPSSDNNEEELSYKIIACIIVAALALIACALLFILRKRNLKNYIFVTIAGIAVCCIVIFTDIQSADSYYGKDGTAGKDGAGTVTLSICCDAVSHECDIAYIPADGIILAASEFSISEGDTVYNLLTDAARTYGIHLETDGYIAGSESLVYISGINYLYEYDFGDLSGWTYLVNGETALVGCGSYALSDGDTVEWIYTRDMLSDFE